MAVIEDLGLSVTVQVDGTPLEEYDNPTPDQQNPDDEGAVAVCHKYVEAKDGAQYEIRLEADQEWISNPLHEDRVLRFLVYIDGECQGGRDLYSQDRVGIVDSAREYETSRRRSTCKFTFGRLSTITKAVDKHPYAVFTFYYRSKDALRSEMIIPRTPSPEPGEDALDNLSQEDIRRLARERIADVKKEKTVKTEASAVKREYGEAFDLTGDSPLRTRGKRAKPETVDLTND